METISTLILKTTEETKERFYQAHGRHPEEEKKLFINWYLKEHSEAPVDVLLHELEEHYLFITEDRIKRILNETE